MDDYNFWRDLFDTYQSLPDWLKLLWLVVPPGFVLALTGLILRHRLAIQNFRAATGATTAAARQAEAIGSDSHAIWVEDHHSPALPTPAIDSSLAKLPAPKARL